MKKIQVRTFLMLFVLLVADSCKKSLDIDNTTTIIRDNYVVDLKSCENVLNGIYAMLNEYIYHGVNTIYPELAADNIKPSSGRTSLINIYTWEQSPTESFSLKPSSTNTNLNSVWTAGYTIIRQCNFLLENVDKFKAENEETADRIKGESLAIRAMTHHLLVITFAQPYRFTKDASHVGIPYITTSDFTQPVSRQSVSEVYNNIIKDLAISSDLLPMYGKRKSYFSKNAAKALLSRVFLYVGDYPSAKKYALEVILQIPMMPTVSYPYNLFRDNDEEAILQALPETSRYFTFFASYYFRFPNNPYFVATTDIASLIYERVKDKRCSWVTRSTLDWVITKFPIGVSSIISEPTVSYYPSIIRSSELYLVLAESFAKMGDERNAGVYLDSIRQRADETAPATTATGVALLDSIYKERRKELAFEGIRLFDLLRTGNGIYRKDFVVPRAQNLPYPNDKMIAPIPMLEVNISKLSQNKGY